MGRGKKGETKKDFRFKKSKKNPLPKEEIL